MKLLNQSDSSEETSKLVFRCGGRKGPGGFRRRPSCSPRSSARSRCMRGTRSRLSGLKKNCSSRCSSASKSSCRSTQYNRPKSSYSSSKSRCESSQSRNSIQGSKPTYRGKSGKESITYGPTTYEAPKNTSMQPVYSNTPQSSSYSRQTYYENPYPTPTHGAKYYEAPSGGRMEMSVYPSNQHQSSRNMQMEVYPTGPLSGSAPSYVGKTGRESVTYGQEYYEAPANNCPGEVCNRMDQYGDAAADGIVYRDSYENVSWYETANALSMGDGCVDYASMVEPIPADYYYDQPGYDCQRNGLGRAILGAAAGAAIGYGINQIGGGGSTTPGNPGGGGGITPSIGKTPPGGTTPSAF